jgi:prepilin-type N-terminal cleavage/methylation domain-containing protein
MIAIYLKAHASRQAWRECCFRHRSGFTLIELLGAIAIIAALTVCPAAPPSPSMIPVGLADTTYAQGKSYFGRSNYVEYIAGDMPLIISAPHGGTLRPAEIPDRRNGEFTSDAYTEELARTVQQMFRSRFGHCPHVVLCRLDRRKVDCNRGIQEGADDHPGARQAWTDYHRFIEIARSNVLASAGTGFYIDLHGQSHPIKRIELGYCLTDSLLTNADRVVNGAAFADHSTIRTLARRTGVPFAELLRGTNSIGGLLAARGYPAVPSPVMPDPGPGNSYFDGGYSARRHSSLNGGTIDGVQMEVNYTGIRDNPANRTNFSLALMEAINAYFVSYYGLDLNTGKAFGSK